MQKNSTKLTAQSHPKFASYLDIMEISLIEHEDGTFEFMCVKPDGSWMNGFDFTTADGALNAALRKLGQGRTFARPLTADALGEALKLERLRGIGKPSHELQARLNKWDKKHKG